VIDSTPPKVLAVGAGRTEGESNPLLNCGISLPVLPRATDEVTVLDVAATGICEAVMPDSPLPGYCGIFKTPALKLAAPLVPVVVSDWKGTCVVEGVPEISENAGWD